MERYYLDDCGKPCLWPVPGDCLWTGGLNETGGRLGISAGAPFQDEAGLFAEALNRSGKMMVEFCGGDAGLRLTQCENATLGEEGYSLEVDVGGIALSAASPHGAFNGLMTLYQLIDRNFATALPAARIADRPCKPFRGVRIPLPTEAALPWFYRFIDLISGLKLNRLLLDLGCAAAFTSALEGGSAASMSREIAAYAGARHIEIIPYVMVDAPEKAGERLPAAASAFGAKRVAVELLCDYADAGDSAAGIFAGDIRTVHAALAAHGLGLALSSIPLHPDTGSRRLRYNPKTGRNDVVPSTFEAADRIPKDILILDGNHGGISADTESAVYFASRGFRTVFAGCEGMLKGWEAAKGSESVLGAFVEVKEAGPGAPGAGGNMLASLMRVSLMLWWQGLRPDHTSKGCLLPLRLEKEIAQLYPMERDRLEESAFPSAGNPGYHPVELRGFYNSPLMHSYWRVDDHFMMFLENATTLRNSVPFSLFEGALDFRFDNAFVMAGGSWNDGIYGIPVGRKAAGLCFLHAYIFSKKQFIEGFGTIQGKAVGRYRIRYADGSEHGLDIVYGRDICFWKNYDGTNEGAYGANPALMGVSDEGLHYTIFSREWANPEPDVQIESIDVLPSRDLDGRIALFGVTAVDQTETEAVL